MPYVVPERRHRPNRRLRGHTAGSVSAAERERRISEMIHEALTLLEDEQLGTTRHRNPDDDDEDPTRRLGTVKKRQ